MHETRDGYRGATRAHTRVALAVSACVAGYGVVAEVLPRAGASTIAYVVAGWSLAVSVLVALAACDVYLRVTRPRFCECTRLATWHVVSGAGEEWACCAHLDDVTAEMSAAAHGAPVTATRIAHAEYPLAGPDRS